MNIKVYSLSYCEKCIKLKQELTDAGIDFEDLDADKHYDESIQLEGLLRTRSYPIVAVQDADELTYFINESRGPQKLTEGVYTLSFATVENLLYQIKNFIN